MVITIDGLSGNGKTTLATKLAKQIGFKNFNTGAVYRCIALHLIENKINIEDIDLVLDSIKDINIDFVDDKVLLNNIDVSKKIRNDEITFYSTKWGTNLDIKSFVRSYQQKFILNNNVIMEGRDIATRIAPNADLKFYLYSDFDTRVERLWNKDKTIDKSKVRKNLEIIDDLDINGGNFIKPQSAIEIDVSNYTIEEVYDIMMKHINDKMK